ncbi:hypothetical protein [Mycobacterium sp.]|uniref:hypothetical protein n=1 Tax=Mycobacterium sp. TaxID=1785 RepID=UPI0039C8E9A1
MLADAPTLSLTDVGSEPTMAFYGATGVTSLTVPVPLGLLPAALDVVVEPPVNLSTGTLTVTQDDRTLARVVLPASDRVPLSIPLTGVRVTDNAVTLTLRSYLVPLENYCLDPSNPLRLTEASIRYEGVEAPPRTVADFLPPVLRKLTLFVPRSPSRAESDAAIRLATAVVAHYGKQNTAVAVAALDEGQTAPGPSLPLERNVVIREQPDSGVALQGDTAVPSLLISGPPNDLTNQTRAMWGDFGRLALSSKAVVGPLRSSPQLPPDVTTLRQLGQPGVNATALAPQVSIALDQTRLGRPAHNVRVHLRGSYTPLPSSVGGQLVAMIGGETIARWPTDNTGIIDYWVDVPDRLLQRYTNLGVAINISGNTGRCGEFQPITLTIDGDSPVESKLAKPPLPGGFQALPQALMPRVEIGIGESFDDTLRAVMVLVGLQRLSALPIDTVVKSLEEAITSPNPAVLVDADGWTDDRITLPVNGNSAGHIVVEDIDGTSEPGELTLDPTLRFGSLQTLYDGKRTLLIATSNNAPQQLDVLLSWLDSNVERWSRLTGNALIAVPDRNPVLVATANEDPPTSSTSSRPALLWWAIGPGVAAVVAMAAWLILLRGRRSRGRP